MLKKLLLFFFLLSASVANAAPINFLGAETGAAGDEATSPNVSLSTTTVKTGTYSYRVHGGVGGSAEIIMQCIAATGAITDCSVANTFGKMDFNYHVLPSSTDTSIEIAYLENVSFSPMAYLKINQTGHLFLNNSAGTTLATGATALTQDTWYRIEFQINKGATGAYEVKINGASEFTGTGNFTTGNMRVVWFGELSNTAASNPDFFYDNMVVDSAAYPGAVFVHRMAPAGDGATAQWTSGTAPSNYTTVNEVPMLNTNYEMSTTAGAQTTLVSLASSASSGIVGTVTAAKVWTSRREDISVTSADKVRTIESATTVDTTALDLPITDTNSFSLQSTKPSGGAWTTAALDATQIGCNETNAVAVRLNAISMMVLSNDVSSFNPNRMSLMGVGF